MSREIDAKVAEHVMGINFNSPGGMRTNKYEYCKPYSTDIAAAWEVVEKMKPVWPQLSFDPKAKKWDCLFEGPNEDEDQWLAFADTAPMAIALASLKAKGVEVE